MEYETFIDDIKDSNGVLRITIPTRLAKFTGMEKGDLVKVMIKKIEAVEG
jgi:hypothetical protein